jgi:hypothetical protein
MEFKKSHLLYFLAMLLFLGWIMVLAISQEGNQLFVYGVLQTVLYLCISLDVYQRKLLRIFIIIGFVYKCFMFVYGLQWMRDATQISFFEMIANGAWKQMSPLTKAVFFDLLLMTGVLTLFVVGVTLICVGGCALVCVSPCLPDGYATNDEKKRSVDFEKCFSRTQALSTDVCCICLVEHDQNTSQSNSCGHMFHSQCIKEWIGNNHSACPLCKQEFGKSRIVIAVNKV